VASPARQQYLDLKRQHPDAILLYRLGDFYEMFDDDAILASRTLGIQLTARSYPRGEGKVPMCGVPHHAIDTYIKRLIDAGHNVAVCEQSSPAGKGLVDRAVVRVFTPGTVVEAQLLDFESSNYLAAVAATPRRGQPGAQGEHPHGYGLAFVDVASGEVQATEIIGPSAATRLEAELVRIGPAECLVQDDLELAFPPSTTRSGRDTDWRGAKESVREVSRALAVSSLEGFGLGDMPAATMATAALISYLRRTNEAALRQIRAVRTYSTEDFMLLDRYTRSSLELVPEKGNRDRHAQWTLLGVLDRTVTGMGKRQLRNMVGRPLLNIAEIEGRLDAVEAMLESPVRRLQLREVLSGIGDIERTSGRAVQGRTGPQELLALRDSLGHCAELRSIISTGGEPDARLASNVANVDPCADLVDLLERAVAPDLDGMIAPGHSNELDGLKAIIADARALLAGAERSEVAATGISGLKVGYNRVFGYYIEIPKAAAATVPEHYVRQQTLVNAERFFTPEIKEVEAKILGARSGAEALEKRLFEQVVAEVAARHDRLLITAAAVGELDVFRSLAEVASERGYVRPAIDESCDLAITAGRHPVVEVARRDQGFVPNDCLLSGDQPVIVLTGPNMGGKSTMLRTVALIVLMAQIGSFVPAESARIGLVDRIFSRVGAQDDIAAGQSTFMTEMVETANILHHASERSLLILDEIGRGTSTYDGLAIARAVLEFVFERARSRTLFATHYHELIAMEDELAGIRNFHTDVAEEDGRVVFMHRIVPGGADRSYGIHVARLAGLPYSVTIRAERLLRALEKANAKKADGGPQLALFGDPDLVPRAEIESVAVRILDQLLALDLSNTTPMEAINALTRLQDEGRASR
jgi:DNA mismatch repair protein MutS